MTSPELLHPMFDTHWEPLSAGIYQHLPELAKGGRLTVFIALWSRRNPKTGQLNPKIARLVEDTGLSLNVVKRAVHWLSDRGFIVVASGQHSGCSNAYILKAIPWVPRSKSSEKSIENEKVVGDYRPPSTESGLPGGLESGLPGSPNNGLPGSPENGPQRYSNQDTTNEATTREETNTADGCAAAERSQGKGGDHAAGSGHPHGENKDSSQEPRDLSGLGNQHDHSPAGANRNSSSVTATATKSRKGAKEPMTDAERDWFLSSASHMEIYLRFGRAAYRTTTQESSALRSTPSDWLKHKPENVNHPMDKINGWTVQQYAGYYWAGVCRWRESKKIPLTFPSSRLFKEIQKLIDANGNHEAYILLFRLVSYFDLFKYLNGDFGSNWVMDEATFNHASIKQTMMSITANGREWVNDQFTRMTQGLPFRKQSSQYSSDDDVESFYAN